MDEIKYKPIGVIHSPFKEPKGTPIQPAAAKGIRGTVEVFPEYAKGLKDVDGFSHLILIYHFHLSRGASLEAKPYMDNEVRGIFAMRGLVRLVKREGLTLHIQDVDIVDGTPLLDIKPYVPEFDTRKAVKIGWLEKRVHMEGSQGVRLSKKGSLKGPKPLLLIPPPLLSRRGGHRG